MKIMDLGMFDGSDTRYYLECGHTVIAIEANPALCGAAREKFATYLNCGQLIILNIAVSNGPGPVELTICGQDLGSSSLYPERLTKRFPLGSYHVDARTLPDIMRQYWKPDFVKIDIEGADEECVLSLTRQTAPRFLSCEAPKESSRAISHLSEIGYTHFKLIQQMSFRSLPREALIADRAARKLIRALGFDEPRYVKRNGRLFLLGHSAGPVPWESDGRWERAEDVLAQWKHAKGGWYDIHACQDDPSSHTALGRG